MADIYVDLSLGTSGGAGTSGDPLNGDEFRTHFNATNATHGYSSGETRTYHLKGSKTYTSQFTLPSGNDSDGFTIQKWAGNNPPKIICNLGSPLFNLSVQSGENAQTWNFKKIMSETIAGGGQVIKSLGSNATVTLNIENSVFTRNISAGIGFVELECGGSFTNTGNIKGCDFTTYSSGVLGTVAISAHASTNTSTSNIIVDSCYFECPNSTGHVFEARGTGFPGDGQTADVTYKYCAFYNSNSLAGIGTITQQGPSPMYLSVTDGGNNDDSRSTATSQKEDIRKALSSLSLPDDIMPNEGSAIIDAGNPSLGLTDDIMDTLRNPDIGSKEYEEAPVLCWNYTARYKNSNRLYRANGGGKYPSQLKVPGSVDASTGRMIDEGQLIDPSNYDIIQ